MWRFPRATVCSRLWRTFHLRFMRARLSALSVNPAPANRSPAWRCSACWMPRRGGGLAGVVDAGGWVASGAILFDGKRLDTLGPQAMRKIRGKQIGAIFQDPLVSLNPLLT